MAWWCSLVVTWLCLARGPSGPKSGHFLLTSLAPSWILEVRGEGFSLTMEADEEGSFDVPYTWCSSNTHGTGPEGPLGASSLRPLAIKRSLKRAQRRANQYGWTVYKGQILRGETIAEAVKTGIDPAGRPPFPKGNRGQRAAILSWNCGGLTTELYQEVLEWIQHQNIAVCFLQGTKWKDQRVWSAGGFSVIQSGEPTSTKHAHAGLLTFVSKQLCATDDISFADIAPGRLLHVRCNLGSKALDLINFYQHPDTVTSIRDKPLEARQTLWMQLDGLMHGLAHRNIMLLGGDFNCTVMGHSPTPAKPMPDADELSGLLKKYHCQSVRTDDGTPSYVGAAGQSTIDFIFMRSTQMDKLTRTGQCLKEFPLASWRAVIDHRPIVTSLSLAWTCWFAKRPQPTKLKRFTQENMYQAWSQRTTTWSQVQQQLQSACQNMEPNMEAFHAFANQTLAICASTFGPAKRNLDARPHRPLIAQLWHHYKLLRRLKPTTLSLFFEAWMHFCHVKKLKIQLSNACREAKQARLHRVVEQAQEAAARHDSRKLYSIIRSLTPKQPFRLIRLQGHRGTAISAPEECRQLEGHFANVFMSKIQYMPPPMQSLETMPFTFDDLCNALAKAPPGKAVAPGTLPNLLIRSLAFELAEWLWGILHNLWIEGRPTIPQLWKDAWLSLLAKRAVRQPRDIRPIALTDGLGKIILGLLTTKLMAITYPVLRTLPIFAFIPQRGTEEALMFVFQHCRTIRDGCARNSQTFWTRHAGHPTPAFFGGAILSLDMSQAFDRLPRHLLHQGFNMTGVPSELALLFEHWLHEARYHIHHRGIECSILTGRGVRQGCKASPLEWTIFLCAVIRLLDKKLPQTDMLTWTMSHLITYADDLISRWTLHSPAAVHTMLVQIGIVLDTLESVGMQVNLDKTAFLLRLSGRSASGLLKKIIVKQPSGTWIRIPRTNGSITLIPLVDCHTYLGAKISFFSFEDQTLAYRLQIGRATFLRLRAWLLRRHSYPLALRVQLWQCCVRSSYLYGIHVAGLTSQGLIRLHRRFVSEIRSIARSPRHITHESTPALFDRLGLTLPSDHLREVWTQQYDRRCLKWEGLETDDFLKTFDIHQPFCHLMQVLAPTNAPVHLDEVQLCPYCDFSTQYQAQLTKHLHSRHAVAKCTNTYIGLRDALAGLPQCAHCSRFFTTFAGLRKHIIKNSCPDFESSRPWQAALADDPRLRSMAHAEDWNPLWQDEDLVTTLRKQCVLCNQVVLSTRQLADHLRRDHPKAWEAAQPYSAPYVPGTTGKHCKACGQRSTRSHACPVLRQLAMITAMQKTGQSVPEILQPPLDTTQGPPLSTPVKRHKPPEALPTGKTVKIEFHPARDALGGLPQCAHCGSPAHSAALFQRHIESGRCPSFDCTKPIGSHVPCTWKWLTDLISDEMPIPALEHQPALQALSNACVLCGQKMGHTKSILQHMQRDHAQMLEQATTAHGDLLQYMAMFRPCCCTYVRPPTDHKCPVHYQILLLRFLKDHPLRGMPLSSPDTAELLQAYWHDPEARATLTQKCSICHILLPTVELAEHLQSHPDFMDRALPLLPLAQSPFMDCCEACLHSDEPPDWCPVALNICGQFLSNGSTDHERRRLHGRSDGLSCKSPGEGGTRETKTQERTLGTCEQHIESASTTDQSPCPASPSPRISAPSTGHGRSVHHLHTGQPSGHLAPATSRSRQMEGGGSTECPTSHPPTTPVQLIDTGIGHTDGEAHASSAQRQGLAESSGESNGDKRGHVELPPVRPRAEKTDPSSQKGYSEGAPGRTQRIGEEPCIDTSVQEPEECQWHHGHPNHPLAFTGDDAFQPTLGIAAASLPQQCMAAHPCTDPPTPEPIQSPGGDLGQELERKVMRPEVARANLSLRLANPHGVTCFVNANLQAFIWGTVQRQDAMWQDFGKAESAMQELLMSRPAPVYAMGLPGFDELRQVWGHFDKQADASEFLHHMLEWARPFHVDMSWTRRVQVPDEIQIFDLGSRFMPPTLQPLESGKEMSLQNLVTAWHEHQGMRTCFETAAPMLGFHLDQFRPGHLGAHRDLPLPQLPDEVLIPIWNGPDSSYAHHREYAPVAELLHRGLDRQGHLQAGLLSDQGWYLTNDHQVANINDPDLSDHLHEVVFIWLVRSDVFHASGIARSQEGRDTTVHQVMTLLHQKNYTGLLDNAKLMRFLRSSCGACGCLYFSEPTLAAHFKQCSPGLWLELRRQTQAMQATLRCFNVPCGWCDTKAPWSTEPLDHSCPVATAIAICQIYHSSVLRPMSTMFSLDAPRGDMVASDRPALGDWLAWDTYK